MAQLFHLEYIRNQFSDLVSSIINSCSSLGTREIHQHKGAKWFIHSTKHSKENQYRNLDARVDHL